MVGILVHGNNHFILSGAAPSEAQAPALTGHWSLVQIVDRKTTAFGPWEIRGKEFRQNPEWAMMVPGDRHPWKGFAELLAELASRGGRIKKCSRGSWVELRTIARVFPRRYSFSTRTRPDGRLPLLQRPGLGRLLRANR